MLADIMVEKMMKPIIFRYLEETYPNENMEILDKNVHKEYKDILSRTSSIGGLLKNGSLQVTLVIGAYAIAIIHVLGEKIDEEKFKALIDYVDNSEEMKKMYGGKNAFSDKEIKGRIKQAKFSQENHKKYKMNWLAEFKKVENKDEYFITYTECGICKLAKQENVEKYVKYMCAMDYVSFELKNAVLDRTKTLGYGDDCCNFHVMSQEVAKEKDFVKSKDAK